MGWSTYYTLRVRNDGSEETRRFREAFAERSADETEEGIDGYVNDDGITVPYDFRVNASRVMARLGYGNRDDLRKIYGDVYSVKENDGLLEIQIAVRKWWLPTEFFNTVKAAFPSLHICTMTDETDLCGDYDTPCIEVDDEDGDLFPHYHLEGPDSKLLASFKDKDAFLEGFKERYGEKYATIDDFFKAYPTLCDKDKGFKVRFWYYPGISESENKILGG